MSLQHWETSYHKSTQHSWDQESPESDLAALGDAGLGPADSVIDVGGGDGAFTSALLRHGHTDLTILDIADSAVDAGRLRLGDQQPQVSWVKADVRAWAPDRTWRVWRDCETFHFLTTEQDRGAYRQAMAGGTAPGSLMCAGTFDADGPPHCSGLPVARYTRPRSPSSSAATRHPTPSWDSHGNEEADDRVGCFPSCGNTGGTDQDGKGGESIGAGVQAVCDEGGRSNLATNPDPEDRDGLVADEPDESTQGNPPELVDGLGVNQSRDGLVPSDDCGESDHGDHEGPGQVLGSPVAVGVAVGRRPAPDREGEPERQRGQGVGEVVDGVGQQRHRPGDGHHRELRESGRAERHQADLDGPDALGAGRQGVVEGISGVVRVRAQELDKAASQTAVLAMVVMAVVVMAVVVIAVVVIAVVVIAVVVIAVVVIAVVVIAVVVIAVIVVIRVGVLVAVARILGAHSAPPRGAARSGVASSWWCLGTPGPACSASKTASWTSRATWSFSTR